MDEPLELSVVLPCYNESEAIEPVIREIRSALADWPGSWELLVVDDASTDDTAERADQLGVRVIRRSRNEGVGAALKAGIRAARGRLVAKLDADGSYVAAYLPQMLACFPDCDQVSGARTSEQGSYRPLRFAVKWVIRKLAEVLTGRRIPDLNTGLKVFRRDLMLAYLWALPDGFSSASAMTLAFVTCGLRVAYVPVEYRRRIGYSKFRPVADTARYLATVVRVIYWFRPLNLLVPLALALGLAGLARGSWVLGVAAGACLGTGLLAEAQARSRRHP